MGNQHVFARHGAALTRVTPTRASAGGPPRDYLRSASAEPMAQPHRSSFCILSLQTWVFSFPARVGSW